MDASLIAHDYVGDEKQEYSTATNDNKEEHEMLNLTPQQVQQQTNINQSSTGTQESQDKENKEGAKRVTKAGFTLIAVLIVVILLISLIAIIVSIISYSAADSCKVDEREYLSKILTQFDTHKTSMDLMLMQLDSTLSQLIREPNVTPSNANTDLLINQFKRNISQLFIQLSTNISQLLIQLEEVKNFNANLNFSRLQHCGPGEWHRVAYLNMSDPSGQCPSVWREYNTRQFRACGRPISIYGSRSAKFYPTNRQYDKVCGRVIAIQVASPDAFHSEISINEGYMDGVSITYGSPRNHIWTFVGSYSETARGGNVCPCDYSSATQPPSFVGTSYYCESGNPTSQWRGRVFPNDKLWDGKQCLHEGTCCTGANTPPWFSVNLSTPTSADIEVRIMGSESTENEDTPVELLEIFVQ